MGEGESVDLADGDASVVVAVVGAEGPLGLGISAELLDLSEVGLDVLDGVDLPVGVGLGLPDGIDLEVVGLPDGGVLGVVGALIGILEGKGFVTSDDSLDGVEIAVLDGGDQGVGVVGESLVGDEALEQLGADVNSFESEEETGLELGVGGGGNGVLSSLEGKNGSGEHIN